MATLPITTRALAVVPNATEVTLFLDSANSNAMTVKFSDCTYRVIDGSVTQLESQTALTDALDKQLGHLTCAAAKGVVSMADLTAYMQAYNLYFTSSLDASGNLVQSITTTPPTGVVVTPDFTLSGYSGVATGTLSITGANTVASTSNIEINVDRDGLAGDIAVTLAGAPTGVTVSVNSFLTSALGVATAYPNTVKAGTSYVGGTINYDGAAVAGTYTFTVVLSSGSVSRYIAVSLVIS